MVFICGAGKEEGRHHVVLCWLLPSERRYEERQLSLPRIDDTLDMLTGVKWFSPLNLKSGYWQVKINPKVKEKTTGYHHRRPYD
ncbi:unnamed protein product [Parnassius mnemosyne]|uniref:RNA-directed DNA polymerase-like protein n=1 Tax=Parnassius mnemosyne TaxID=213953 RepID=A0AAV1KN39_9NEOP